MQPGTRARRPRSRRALILGASVAAAVLVAAGVIGAITAAQPSAPPVAVSTSATPSSTPTADPGFAADEEVYPLEGLPTVDVFAVVAALPTDTDPMGALTGLTARANTDLIPVFAHPTAEPVAALPRDGFFEGTTVAVIERQPHWVHVLLTGRAAVPAPGQLTGWLRAQDVVIGEASQSIDVDLGSRTIDIVSADGTRERIAADFGYGVDETPTPRGRSFVMLVRAEPTLTYTDGHPIVYLSVQSSTLAGFDGADVAVTAFHYHDERSGAVSNGCLRLDAAAIDRLAQLPLGTAVSVH